MELPFSNVGNEGEQEFGYRRLLTLPDQIAEQVSRAIMRGDYGPGDPIKEQALATLFDVSRGPVREALRILEKDGVVRLVPNRGARVTRLTTREVNDIFEIREALSKVGVKYLCNTENEPLRQKFIAGAEGLTDFVEDPDMLSDYVHRSYELKTILAESCDNVRLAEMIRSLARQTNRYTQLGLRRPERRHESAQIWIDVADAVRARDVARARDLISRLINDSRRAAVAELEREAADAAPASDGPGRHQTT
ncbi:GntR family transcriptional regulator [Pseudooceanicola aestuarii]|uniref:GntR family transcriptional regulator n=1 Tax=Pseudooceanicola aestuarii TaxID=2697319 RepID=UPI0013CF5D30|nr:GntR family transcriptional regulator [Pseudooceanicola aestuarii]